MKGKFSLVLMILPVYFLINYGSILNNRYLSHNYTKAQILSTKIRKNDDTYIAKSQIISARDNQHPECLEAGSCKR